LKTKAGCITLRYVAAKVTKLISLQGPLCKS